MVADNTRGKPGSWGLGTVVSMTFVAAGPSAFYMLGFQESG